MIRSLWTVTASTMIAQLRFGVQGQMSHDGCGNSWGLAGHSMFLGEPNPSAEILCDPRAHPPESWFHPGRRV